MAERSFDASGRSRHAAAGTVRLPAVDSKVLRPDARVRMDSFSYLATNRGRLAFRLRRGAGPAILFLPGYASDMAGTKAQHLADWAAARGRAMLRFDWSGCGHSPGRFEEQTIGGWLEDARAMLATLDAPAIVVGSSMGGWIALLLARAAAARVAGLVLLAPAPDFTRWGVAQTLTGAERIALERDGVIERPSAYGPAPVRYARALIEEGAAHGLMGGPIGVAGPVRILHGQADPDVPWRLSLDLADRLAGADVRLTLVKDGDHRLSRPGDLALLTREVADLAA
jgi:pimeloyl-ACP methyl ester carboxylesterase